MYAGTVEDNAPGKMREDRGLWVADQKKIDVAFQINRECPVCFSFIFLFKF